MLVRGNDENMRCNEQTACKIYESYEVVGTLKPEVAKELDLPMQVKVVAGAGDNAARRLEQGLSAMACAISRLGRAERYLFPAKTWVG